MRCALVLSWALGAAACGDAATTVDADAVAGTDVAPDGASDATPDATLPTTTDTARDDTSEVATGVDTADAATAEDADAAAEVQGDAAEASDAGDAGDVAVAPGPVVFVAQGDLGRTTRSCDDGRTWVDDRSWDTEGDAFVCGAVETMRCYADAVGCRMLGAGGVCETVAASCDCDHHHGAPMGIAAGDGAFVATWGWGRPGTVRRSADGVSWQAVLDGHTFGGIAFGAGRFVVGDRQPWLSIDAGATWDEGGAADLQAPSGDTVWNVRRFGFGAGRFVVTGESGAARDVLVSADGGATWQRPTTLPAACAADARGIAGDGGTIVIVHGDGRVCRSTDGGVTFEEAAIGGAIASGVLHDGARFVTWGRGQRYTSVDGRTWEATATTPADVELDAVARSPETGTLVAVRGGWQVWYEAQRFYRSTDGGVTWETLGAGAFTPGHRIRHIAAGRLAAGATCE